MVLDYKYERAPQNDLVGIRYVKEDYESSPARGLTHGLQKDAIQNSVGAAKNIRSLDGWKMTFELVTINGNEAMVFWDEGTFGLTGDILTPDQIRKKSASGELDASQNLSRFLSVFESGGNVGPGSYGRGKLVFQACSFIQTILCDSLREDNTYVAFKRTIRNNELVQTQVFEGEKAEVLIKTESDGVLQALSEQGTRITILELDSIDQVNGLSIGQAFKNSFDEEVDDLECESCFDMMIQETWWEILLKYDANIVLRWGDRTKKVTLAEPLLSILSKKDKEDDWRIYEKEKINVKVGDETYRVKKLRLAVSPPSATLTENYREIVVQRKRMKIGKINKNIEPVNQIRKRFSGIIELDQRLEELMLEPENLTHYGYKNLRNNAVKQVRQVVRKHLGLFQEELGLIKKSGDQNLEREIQEALQELNEQASDLGFMTSFGTGRKGKDLTIRFVDFILPNTDSLRVEYSDTVGPIKCELKNTSNDQYKGGLTGTLVQQGNPHIQKLIEQEVEIPANDSIEIDINEFQVDPAFRYGEGVILKVELPDQKVKNTRMFWLGIEEPDKENKHPFSIAVDPPVFPRKTSKRVEIEDVIEAISVTLTNNVGSPISSNVSVSIRRGHTEDKKEIVKLIQESGRELQPLAEVQFSHDEVDITEQEFGFFNNEPLDHNARRCELYVKVTAADYYPSLEITKGDTLAPRKKIPFWIGIDDPGQSIFAEIFIESREKDPRRSWFSGMAGAGFSFHLNQGHPAFQRINDLDDDTGLKNDYYKEEMLKQAFIISLQNENFKGLFSEIGTGGDSYESVFKDVDAADEGVITYEELVGLALHKLYS